MQIALSSIIIEFSRAKICSISKLGFSTLLMLISFKTRVHLSSYYFHTLSIFLYYIGFRFYLQCSDRERSHSHLYENFNGTWKIYMYLYEMDYMTITAK